MDKQFEPKSLTIRALLTDSDSLYQIPPYQRSYKWVDEHVEQLWDDIFDSYQNAMDVDAEGDYFLGAMITAEPEMASNYKDVVDGQQRLTTLMILCCVIRDFYPKINNTSDEILAVTKQDIERAISVRGDGKTRRLKLCTHDSVKSDFVKIIIEPKSTRNLVRPPKKDLRLDVPKYKFINAAVILREKLATLTESEAGRFVDFLFNRVKVIRIDCAGINSAIRIFRVINDRGLDLTASDLVKSALLQNLHSAHKDDDLRHRRGQFMSDWNALENSVAQCESDLDEMFTLYEYCILAENPRKGLYEELRKKFQMRDPNEVVAELKDFAELYKTKIFDDTKDIAIYSLWYIPWSVHWRSVMLIALHRKYENSTRLAKLLCRFYYLFWIAGKTLSSVKQTSFNAIKKVGDGAPIEDIESMLEDKIAEYDIVQQVIQSLTSDAVAGAKWCKPLLLMMEYNAADYSKLSYIEWDRKIHLEHILPVENRKAGWEHISESDAFKYLNSGGNLTLLSGKKNIAASNKPFHIKMDAYKGRGLHGEHDEGITAFVITQKIVEDYHRGKYDKQWNEEAMRDRKKWFLEQAAKILDIKIPAEMD